MKRVVIIGAGVAGLTAAWWLGRAGWKVTVVERAADLRSDGYMIGLSGPGYRVADEMGLLPALRGVARDIGENVFRDRQGHEILRLHYHDLLRGFEWLTLARTELVATLHAAALPYCTMRFATSLRAMRQDDAAVTVTLDDGSMIEADLLIGADGAMVKVATTKAQRKLFFNLRSMKQSLKEDSADADAHRTTLTQGEVETMARRLNVKREEVLEMETRLSGGDVALEPQVDDAGEESFAPIAYLADDSNEPTRVLEAQRRDWLAGDGIAQALDTLDDRSRRIVEERWLKVNDDSSGGMTLHELAADYGVSAERIRQIEVAAMKKMRKALEAGAA